jgi:O-antigen ligase
MPDPVHSKSPSRRSRSLTQTGSGAVAALLPVLACFLGGATQKWAEGIVVGLLGFFLLLRPPRLSLGLASNTVFVLFAGVGAIAFLPARWFFLPAWRSILVGDFGTSLPQTASAQPWISLTCLLSLIAGASWLYLVSTQELDLRAVRFQLRLFVTGIVLLAAISILFYMAHFSPSFWINVRGFGPFPNRNQTGDLLGITAIVLLACGQDDLRHSRKRWMLWLIGLGILITAIILNFSRAGVIILVGGSALWIAVVAFRVRSRARLALGVSFLLLLFSALLVLGGATVERFHILQSGDSSALADFRWKIFHDAFDLIRASPWCGVGLGNFEALFATFRRESITEMRVLHPESDWIWLWTELGWPAVLLAMVGAALLVRHVLPLKEGTNQRFRLAALVGAVCFAAHGLVDVSGHRVGTAYAGLFLLGAALHRPLSLKRSVIVPLIFRLVGVGLLISGISWTMAERKKTLLPGSVGVTVVKELSPVAIRGRNFAEAIALNTRALEWAPLDWQLYFARALAEVEAKQADAALDDFRRARFLEPNSWEVPLAEGTAWLATQPIYAATAWREALRRTQSESHRLGVYASMLEKAAIENPEVGRILEEIGVTRHDLVLAYLSRVSGDRFNQELQRFLKNDPDLHTLTEPEKLAIFTLWSERGDADELARQVEEHPDWMAAAWLGVAKSKAARNDFRTAYQLTQKYGEAVAMPRLNESGSLEELQNRYYASPDNYATGYALYRQQMQRGRVDDALLTARHFSERAKAPAYFHFLEAQAWAEKQNWERAWKAWLAYRDATRK